MKSQQQLIEMHKLVEKLKETHDRLEREFQEALSLVHELAEAARSGSMRGEADLVDAGFLFRELRNGCNEMRKEMEAKRAFISLLLATVAAMRAANTGKADTLRGTLASGSVKIDTMPQVPRYGTPEYNQVLAHLGVSDDLIKAGVFALHYRHVADLILDAESRGLEPPIPVSHRPVNDVTYRKKRKV